VEDQNAELERGGNCVINATLKINDDNDLYCEEELLSYIPPEWHMSSVSRDKLRRGARK
jgi:hypothetical protein